MQAPPEKLGSFYLGAEYDLAKGERTELPVNYDARDLTTHAVCIGMTGSGKTGLCIGLLEEAALDRVPAILIDPKGDITNLLLQFPELRPEDFLPWINADDARRKGQSEADYAAATAAQWRAGLADWGIDGERIRALLGTVDLAIYTPGSDAGVPIDILGSLAAPGLDFDTEAEAIRERIGGTVAALLGLAGSDADPARSREGILLATIFEHFWRQGQDLDLARLILSIQNPPVRQLGVFDVDTFFPEKDRFELAMAFNNLVAAPAFQSWLVGEPLDVDRLFFTPEGKPRHSVIYIAHLSDSERMFIVTLILESLVTWMRRQSGTTSLRALLYFDEVFGFFPPSAEPPSKRPLLTLLKQARAFGLGLTLVTQNPVDLDYKGLTNAGTWFIGKLQAERDKERVLAGLEGAIATAGGASRADLGRVITQLGSRVFLLHNVHAAGPVVFNTRWAMSYLRGPLTRPQVRSLMAGRKAVPGQPGASEAPGAAGGAVPTDAEAAAAASAAGAAATSTAVKPPLPPWSPPDAKPSRPAAPAAALAAGLLATPPSLDPGVQQIFVPLALTRTAAERELAARFGRPVGAGRAQIVYAPAAGALAMVRFVDKKRGIDTAVEHRLVAQPGEGVTGVDWERATGLAAPADELLRAPERVGAEEGPFFATVPSGLNTAAKLRRLGGDLADWLYASSRLTVRTQVALGLTQGPDETERAFTIRLQQAAREARDAEVDKLSQKYEARIERVAAKLAKEQAELARDEAEASARKTQTYVGIGTGVLNVLFGRSRRSSASSAVTSVLSKQRMSDRATAEVGESRAEIAALTAEKAELEAELEAEAAAITARWDGALADLTSEQLAPRRTDVDVQTIALAWLPSWSIAYEDGGTRTATIAAWAEQA